MGGNNRDIPISTVEADSSADTYRDETLGEETKSVFGGVAQRNGDLFIDATSADESETAGDGDWVGDSVHMGRRAGLEMMERGESLFDSPEGEMDWYPTINSQVATSELGIGGGPRKEGYHHFLMIQMKRAKICQSDWRPRCRNRF